ncbi:MAG: PEP/pyruvate-binding domain-containing protein [Acidimicrobiales bacterium]
MSTITAHAEPAGAKRQPVRLSDPDAARADVAGAKAANLARAMRAGLPTVEGFVVPVAMADTGDDDLAWLRDAWAALSRDGAVPLVVRSSSPSEDAETSSLAGQFTSVVDVRGWRAFVGAFRRVVESSKGGPMAVLVQRHLDPVLGGVAFGIDPVTGRRDRRVVAAVAGGPWELVGGTVEGRRYELTRRGRIITTDGDPGPSLDQRSRRRLTRLQAQAASTFGQPQDIEWAIDAVGRLWLLQSRPVTAVGQRADGPRLGVGPLAETFPVALSPLELDLWIPPVRRAIAETVILMGAASRRAVRRSPIVVDVDGRVAVDLDLVEVPRRRGLARLDPRPDLRRLAAAWRTGRLLASFPALAADVVATVDERLAALPSLTELADDDLLRILGNVRRHLVAIHGHEMLAAQLEGEEGGTAATSALAAVSEGRLRGLTDDEIVARWPGTLVLGPPRIGARAELPEVRLTGGTPRPMSAREELRLRVRWLHELSSRAAVELGRRLADRHRFIGDVADLTLDELTAVTRGDVVMVDPKPRRSASPPLPPIFRLGADGSVVAERASGTGTHHGIGAGGGRAQGRVAHADPGAGDILVVATLDPGLAPLLPTLAGIVAETGSPLSHLAILAREHGVAAVVGYHGARAALVPGSTVVIDGHTGEVELVEPTPAEATP